MTRWFAVTALAVVLSACGGTAAPVSAPPSSPLPKPASAAPAASSAAAQPAASASAKPAASAAGPPAASTQPAASAAGGAIKIGVLAPLTGTTAEAGMNHRDGVNLYLEQVKNTMAGRAVEAVFVDSQGRADTALTKAKELVENQGVKVIVGFTLTPECYAVAAYVREAKVPMIVSDNCGAANLTTDPRFAGPYVYRTTFNNQAQIGPFGDWAYDQGLRKVVLAVSDYAGGYEIGDAFAWSFGLRGGAIVQEQYPALGTADFGPFMAQLNRDVDGIFAFFPGADGLRWAQQYADYGGGRKLQIMAGAGALARDGNLDMLKDKAVGIVANDTWAESVDTPANKTLLALHKQKFPNNRISSDVANGYIVMQVIQSALEKVGGKIEDQEGFLKALSATNIETAKGPVKFDQNRDVVENIYIYQIVKEGGDYTHKILKTYKDVQQFWDQPPEVVRKFPFGQMKNKWTGMTKDQIAQLGKS